MQPSIARIFVVAFVFLLLVFGLTGYCLYLLEDINHQRRLTNSPLGKDVLAAKIILLNERMQARVADIVHAPETIQAFKTRDDVDRDRMISVVHSRLPNAGRIEMLSSDGDPGFNASLQLTANSPSSVGNFPSTISTHFMVTRKAPVMGEDGTTYGYMLIDQDLRELESLFNSGKIPGSYMELQQNHGKENFDPLLRRGNETAKAMGNPDVIQLPNTNWRLAVWPEQALPSFLAQRGTTYILLGSVMAILAMTIFVWAYAKSTRLLQADMDVLVKLVSDVLHNRLRKRYAVRTREIMTSYLLMHKLAKLMVGKHRDAVNSAGIDHLSQVHNRRAFEAKQRELFRTAQDGWVHSLLILDIDHFKHVNDTYGHDAGDALIVQFGKVLKECLRSSDFIARLGGDEFCVIFPNTPLKKAVDLAQRLRETLPQVVELTPGVMHNLNWSGGMSEYSRNDTSENMALSRADAALLEAKRAGRNCTMQNAA